MVRQRALSAALSLISTVVMPTVDFRLYFFVQRSCPGRPFDTDAGRCHTLEACRSESITHFSPAPTLARLLRCVPICMHYS